MGDGGAQFKGVGPRPLLLILSSSPALLSLLSSPPAISDISANHAISVNQAISDNHAIIAITSAISAIPVNHAIMSSILPSPYSGRGVAGFGHRVASAILAQAMVEEVI